MTKLIPTKPLFILLYGFPGAGKTYLARRLSERLQVAPVQGDRIRSEFFTTPRYDKAENEAVTHLMDYMAEQFLDAGVSVVYDTNALRLSQRRILREMARRARAEALLIWVQIDLESAFGRVASRDRRRSDDKFAMPLDRTSFDNLASHMQNPAPNENYIVVSGKHSFETQERSIVKKLRELGLIAAEGMAPGVIKPGLVNLIPSTSAAGRVDMSRRNITVR